MVLVDDLIPYALYEGDKDFCYFLNSEDANRVGSVWVASTIAGTQQQQNMKFIESSFKGVWAVVFLKVLFRNSHSISELVHKLTYSDEEARKSDYSATVLGCFQSKKGVTIKHSLTIDEIHEALQDETLLDSKFAHDRLFVVFTQKRIEDWRAKLGNKGYLCTVTDEYDNSFSGGESQSVCVIVDQLGEFVDGTCS